MSGSIIYNSQGFNKIDFIIRQQTECLAQSNGTAIYCYAIINIFRLFN